MFRRVESESNATQLPKEWVDQFKQTLLNIYGDKCLKDDRTFEIYAQTYPEEVLLIVSYMGLDKYSSPLTLFLSGDLVAASNPKKTLDNLCDFVGVFFDHYFGLTKDSLEVFEDYIYDWEEEDFNSTKLFFKVTRENVALTMEANLLLGEF
jgi:hypothetical protein